MNFSGYYAATEANNNSHAQPMFPNWPKTVPMLASLSLSLHSLHFR